MLYGFFLLVTLFSLSATYEYIPISNYEEKTVLYNKENDYYIFEFHHESEKQEKYSTFTIFKSEICSYSTDCFIYKSTGVKQDAQGKFIDYYLRGGLNCNDKFFSPNEKNIPNGKYYIVLQNKNKYAVNTTFWMYSSGVKHTISSFQNIFFATYYFNLNELNYYYIPSNKPKYLLFGFKRNTGSMQSELTILENSKTERYRYKSSDLYENSLQLNQNADYLIHLNLTTNSYHLSVVYFYIIQSNYSNYVEAKYNTEEFYQFPVFKKLNVLLDISKINMYYRMFIEYDGKWNRKYIELFLYETDDIEEIRKKEGKKVELLRRKDCNTSEICEVYFIKDLNYKRAVLMLSNFDYPLSYVFKFRYGKQEYFYSTKVINSNLFGLALSIPNIIIQIYRRITNKYTADWYLLLLDIVLHIAYGNIFSIYVNLGGHNSFVFGLVFLGFYLILLFSYIISYKSGENYHFFESLKDSLSECPEYPLLEGLIASNRKHPPSITFSGNSTVKEEREVINEYVPCIVSEIDHDVVGNHIFTHVYNRAEHKLVRKIYAEWKRKKDGGGKVKDFEENPGHIYDRYIETNEHKVKDLNDEYNYVSWQDDTDLKAIDIKVDNEIIYVSFDCEYDIDHDAEKQKYEVRVKLEREGYQVGDKIEIDEHYSCPQMSKGQMCLLNENSKRILEKHYNNKFTTFLCIISAVLGIKSIVDPLFEIQHDYISVKYKKLISGTKKYRASYMENDDNAPPLKFKYGSRKKSIQDCFDEKNMEPLEIPLNTAY